jgi:hypothetical protein
MRPAVAVSVFPGAILASGDTVALGKCFFWRGEVAQSVKKVAHRETFANSIRDEIRP